MLPFGAWLYIMCDFRASFWVWGFMLYMGYWLVYVFVCYVFFSSVLIFETGSGSVVPGALELLGPSNPPASSPECLAP